MESTTRMISLKALSLLIFVIVYDAVVLISCYNVKTQGDIVEYLQLYGHMPYPRGETPSGTWFNTNNAIHVRRLRDAVEHFQMFAGLEVTGDVDTETLGKMNSPRCGMVERRDIQANKDITFKMVSHGIFLPRKGRGKWPTRTLRYKVVNFPNSNIAPRVVREQIRKAFHLWEKVTNLECTEVEAANRQHAHIVISFEEGEHGDGSSFGNRSMGNVAAHAFFPNAINKNLRGVIHFDNERVWTSSPYNHSYAKHLSINLFQVAAHEIGHALGLDHSMFPSSVMHMLLKDVYDPNFALDHDDIVGIQNLYGKKRKLTGQYRTTVGMSKPTVTKKSNELPLERSLTGFWKCFSLTHTSGSSTEAENCYKINTMNFLHAMNM